MGSAIIYQRIIDTMAELGEFTEEELEVALKKKDLGVEHFWDSIEDIFNSGIVQTKDHKFFVK